MGSIILIGAGPKMGLPIARRFAKEGLSVGLIARSTDTLDAGEANLKELGVSTARAIADTADERRLRTALDELMDAHGVPDSLIYNVAKVQRDVVGELSAQDQLDAWNLNVVGALTSAAKVAPHMADRGRGSILITGGRPAPDAMVSLTLGKEGVRALVTILDATYGEQGIHAGTVKICERVVPGTAFDPDLIAEHYWTLHAQPKGEWQHEIVHDG